MRADEWALLAELARKASGEPMVYEEASLFAAAGSLAAAYAKQLGMEVAAE